MNYRLFTTVFFILFLFLIALVLGQEANVTSIQADSELSFGQPTEQKADLENTSIGALEGTPVMFIENVGQFDEGAKFQVRGSDRTIWLAKDAIWVAILEPTEGPTSEAHHTQGLDIDPEVESPGSEDEARQGVAIRLSFVGANPEPVLQAYRPLTTTVSYFIGDDSDEWHPAVPVWGGVRYVDLYPGLDLELDATVHGAASRLVCRAANCQAALASVQLAVEGADSIALEGNRLRFEVAAGTYTLPLLQAVDADGQPLQLEGGRATIKGNFVSRPLAEHGYQLMDRVIDKPTMSEDNPSGLLYSTFLGGNEDDFGYDLALDSAGNATITGLSYSISFPTTPGAFDTGHNGFWDVYVAKLNSTGSALLYSTFLGGVYGDFGLELALDSAGNTTIMGSTASHDFPTTPGAYDIAPNGDYDGFVTKLNPDGSALLYSTFLGGSNTDYGLAIALDSAGNATITGYTLSTDFPTTPGGFDTSYNGAWDVFVAKLNAVGSALLYSTFLGGSENDHGYGLALDSAGNAMVTGNTYSPEFPTTPGAFDTGYNGSGDGFVTKLNTSGSALLYSTFLGGTYGAEVMDLVLDSAGNATVIGFTLSTDFPTTPGAFDTSHNGTWDVFVAKLNAAGSDLLYSTFLGGSLTDAGLTLALDEAGNATVIGFTRSTDFPTTPGGFDTSHNGAWDVFVAKLNAVGSALLYSTFLGGSGDDEGRGLALDSAGNATITGYTASADFPTTPGAFDTTLNVGNDAFLARQDTSVNLDLSIPSVSPVQSLEGQDLIKNKSTAIKVDIRKSGNIAVQDVGVHINYDTNVYTRFYVAEPTNMDIYHVLIADNAIHPLNFAAGEIAKTVYFFSDDFSPSGDIFQASATVDPLYNITETVETNNSSESKPVTVNGTTWSGLLYPNLYIHYFRTDWGSEPVPIFFNYFRFSNQFVNDSYPVSEQRFTPDSSPILMGDTTLFRGPQGLLNVNQLGRWVQVQLAIMRLAHPTADRFIATVPEGWFASTTTGDLTNFVGAAYPQMRELVVAEARLSARPNGYSTAAHEIGHSYKLHLYCEDYDQNCDGSPDRIGSLVEPGLWVDKRIPVVTGGARPIYSFMGAYTDDVEYWVKAADYSKLLSDHQSTRVAASTNPLAPAETVLAVGTFYVTGTVSLDNWYTLSGTELSSFPLGKYSFEYQDANGDPLHQVSFDFPYTMEGIQLNQSPFVYTIPYIPGAAKIAVKFDTVTLAEKKVSSNVPSVTMLSPDGGEQLKDQVTVEWVGHDYDDDTLSYALFYSIDSGSTWEPVAANLSNITYDWDLGSLPTGPNYLVRVIVTDGFYAAEDTSDSTFTIIRDLYIPLVIK